MSWYEIDGWKSVPGTGMRVASIKSDDPELEIAVTRFPGRVGGLEANIQRWRTQVNLPAAANEAEMMQGVEETKIQGRDAAVIDLTGPGGDGLLVAMIIDTDADRIWFFKLAGPAEAIAGKKEGFMRLVKSVRISGN